MHSDPISVLVVEDETLIRMSVVLDLEDAGFNVLEAGNTDEAISLLRTHPEIQALFTDIEIPGSMNGLSLAATVHDRWPPIRIIVTSGRVRVFRRDLPADVKFCPKPYDNTQVISMLREMVAA
ncbi:MAG: two-component response regulator protein [Rhizobium sp.]|nr:two-component response regulator protein [Rhizobium sp.]